MPYFVYINTSVTKQNGCLSCLKSDFFFFAYKRLGYNTMYFSTPDSVSLGAHPGSNFFKNSPERRLSLEEN